MPETAAADPTLGIAAYLKAQERISNACEGRVYRPELPEAAKALMPAAAVVVSPAGGGTLFGRDNLQVTDSRLDVTCYGSTRLQADNLARECARALKNLTLCNWHEVKLYWARAGSNPVSMVDPTTNWPISLVTAQVMHSLNLIP